MTAILQRLKWAVLCVALVTGGGCQGSRAQTAAAVSSKDAVRNNCLSLLCDLLNQQKYVDKLLLIQNTQNRDSEVLRLTTDESIRGNLTAHNDLLNTKELSERDLDQTKLDYEHLAAAAIQALSGMRTDTRLQLQPSFSLNTTAT